MYRKEMCFVLLYAYLLLFSPVYVFAHNGKTDSNGGHYVRSTGEYHYHHGYPAHQHPDGICEYNFDDQTNYNPGYTSSSKKDASSQTLPISSSEVSTPKPEKVMSEIPKEPPRGFNRTDFVLFIVVASAILTVALIFKVYDNERKQAPIEKERRESLREFSKKYGGKPLEECVTIPPGFEIGADGLPKERGSGGWGSLTVYITKSGSCYHTNICQTKASIKVNLATVKQYAPCTWCKAPIIDLGWYFEYLAVKKDFECAQTMKSKDYVTNRLKAMESKHYFKK